MSEENRDQKTSQPFSEIMFKESVRDKLIKLMAQNLSGRKSLVRSVLIVGYILAVLLISGLARN